jgi:N-acetylmuramoyl-L-alanine amidase
MYAPILLLYKAFDAKISWDSAIHGFKVTRGSGGIKSGDSYYREDEVFWLARIITAESQGEPLRGKIAVGNVILNRVRSKSYPNTIYGVIFDFKHGIQFTPAYTGTVYNKPSQESIIAAKMCLEGYEIIPGVLFFFNPRIATSNWISKNRPFAARIGLHDFYY